VPGKTLINPLDTIVQTLLSTSQSHCGAQCSLVGLGSPGRDDLASHVRGGQHNFLRFRLLWSWL